MACPPHSPPRSALTVEAILATAMASTMLNTIEISPISVNTNRYAKTGAEIGPGHPIGRPVTTARAKPLLLVSLPQRGHRLTLLLAVQLLVRRHKGAPSCNRFANCQLRERRFRPLGGVVPAPCSGYGKNCLPHPTRHSVRNWRDHSTRARSTCYTRKKYLTTSTASSILPVTVSSHTGRVSYARVEC